ncbi:MAG: hypothetical protein UW86_C0011G0002 [Microgenomates group bacterium GW2011_GWA1_Microgenomates_45_10]|nr:MAG: hypothetical protein UW86_C0011G0002 [Microgenomates group bacterium GW2011_GWA1_Microgenomates_45_10]KKT97415.1 MAG: hypothetical protein UX00_C0011G0027 [Microgenomates group bacterium GW2011_GWB1_45_17]KKU28885.1 MAG: hypothetical protein UX42_C0006G0037 [Microgenomates group bacterium GW2011_GWC1_46_20]
MTKCKSNSTLINSNDDGLPEDLVNPIVTRKELERFKKIARDDYGVELTDKQAYEQAAAIITFFEGLILKRLDPNRLSNNNE